eukprot:CAMPEP_0180763148 /NCGR_PEP_ID=MMETSP1038_2-20121128/37751_1 /TAXON_ID=632150 /ORGANISM="Azadinium spinosum, Strain 3D9" /LENGTH=74 /DNA_ID=CAMNT_0022797461 /DNA_START=62 /DNA_END=283 /DNA_ORIENTATION=+
MAGALFPLPQQKIGVDTMLPRHHKAILSETVGDCGVPLAWEMAECRQGQVVAWEAALPEVPTPLAAGRRRRPQR